MLRRTGLPAIARSAVLLTAVVGGGAQASFIQLDPRATYLQVDPAGCCGFPEGDFPSAAPLALDGYGLAAGDAFSLRQVGDFAFAFDAPDETSEGLVARFSATTVILPNAVSGPLDRLPDAVDAGVAPFETSLSDVPFDFFVPNDAPVDLTVPEGARYLFFTLNDVFFSDNRDPDQDFGVAIGLPSRSVPEPGSVGLVLVVLLGWLGLSGARRVRSRAVA
jgi:hypothetical protein